MDDLKALLGPARAPFLTLPPVVTLLGLGTAMWRTGGQVHYWYFLLALIGGLAAHISVNALNEYNDYKTGLDELTRRTPFSGGSGTLQARPDLAKKALGLGILSALIVLLIGAFFLWVWGWGIVPLGILGLLVVIAYTPLLTHVPFACLIAPGLGFGILMVMGTDFVLTGSYSWAAFWASLIPFFLVNNLLLLNQFPDVEADKQVGRRHYPMVIGRQKSALLYGVQLALAYLALIAGVALGYLPWPALLGLLTIIIAVPTYRGVRAHADDMEHLIPFMGKNVLINLATPLLMTIGLVIATFL
jgi:1,4-dihydroxy-2-naphthoate octaprenyltransferase